MKIQVIFDRANRLYRFGDDVSGKVVVEAKSDCTCSKVWITYGWRTHGRGDRDKGREEELILQRRKHPFRAGEHKEFPFSFGVPNGPVTYHGHHLNVDWYLTAHVTSPPGSVFKSEQDFLLLRGDPTGAVVLGTETIQLKDLPARSAEQPPSSHGLLKVKAGSPKSQVLWPIVTPILLGLFLMFLMIIIANLVPVVATCILAFILALILTLIRVRLQAIIRNAYKRKLEVGEFWVKPASVYPGGQIHCHVEFRTKRECYLRSVKASICARERVTRTVGTNAVAEEHILDEETYMRPFDQDLPAGRWTTFDCELPVEPDAPATFISYRNRLEWTVTMKADLKAWPDWVKTFPITVLP